MSIEASCHCGAVKLVIAAAPETVTECNCSLCRRYGVLWAYYDTSAVQFSPPNFKTDVYQWNGRHVTFHRCAQCGCVTHWSANNPKRHRMGVNARLMEPVVLGAARVVFEDGAAK